MKQVSISESCCHHLLATTGMVGVVSWSEGAKTTTLSWVPPNTGHLSSTNTRTKQTCCSAMERLQAVFYSGGNSTWQQRRLLDLMWVRYRVGLTLNINVKQMFMMRKMSGKTLWSCLFMRTVKSTLGLHCKGWKFKVGILWKIPL